MLGVKGEQSIGDFWVEAGDEFGDTLYFRCVYVAGYQQGARNQERRFGARVSILRQSSEVFEGGLVGNSCQGPVQRLVVGFKVELDAAAGVERHFRHWFEVAGVKVTVCFPADAENPPLRFFAGELSYPQGKRDLGPRVTAEKTDAGGCLSDCRGYLVRGNERAAVEGQRVVTAVLAE